MIALSFSVKSLNHRISYRNRIDKTFKRVRRYDREYIYSDKTVM